MQSRLPFLILCTALVALGLQVPASQAMLGGTLGQTLWRLAGYFTILTNLGVAAVMLAEVAGHRASARLAGGLTLAILMVALVYHLLLAGLWQPTGLAWWADQGLHTAVPALVLVWWLVRAPKQVTLRDLPVWLVWPIIYLIYALVRGLATGFWPYPFLDPATLGWARVTAHIAGITLAFVGLALVLILAARRSVR